MTDKNEIPKIIQQELSDRTPLKIQDTENRAHAAVLMPLYFGNHTYQLVFTKRTRAVQSHKGQISFPGGAVEQRDKSFLDTALREADEEIGLSRSMVTILGRIDDMKTKSSGFIVHPFIGLIPHPYKFKVNPNEVDRIFSVPLGVFFSDNSPYKEKEAEFQGVVYPGVAWRYDDEIIWGATARIMINFIQIMEGKLKLPLSR